MLRISRLLLVGAFLSACGSTVNAPDATPDVSANDSATLGETATTDTTLTDASGMDATVTDITCVLSCAAPPPGCRYTGPTSCNPPSCGTLVCEDASAPDVPTADIPPADAPADTNTADVTSADGAIPGDASAGLLCPNMTVRFPVIDRRCNAPTDCVVVIHQTDCCGNTAAIGVRTEQQGGFNEAEAVCQAATMRCRCPSMPTIADDGNRAATRDAFGVRCVSNQCTTFVP